MVVGNLKKLALQKSSMLHSKTLFIGNHRETMSAIFKSFIIRSGGRVLWSMYLFNFHLQCCFYNAVILAYFTRQKTDS